jgi:hypothetical protein
MEEKKRAKYGANAIEGHDEAIDELSNAIEDGQVFRNRRRRGGKKGAGASSLFVLKQEERVREKPLPAMPPKKPKTREDLVAMQ